METLIGHGPVLDCAIDAKDELEEKQLEEKQQKFCEP
jgi:hypothetical protein